MSAHHTAFIDRLTPTFRPDDEGRAARTAAQRHLAALPQERRAQLEREWMAAEADVDANQRPLTFTPERWAELNAEWDEPAKCVRLEGEL